MRLVSMVVEVLTGKAVKRNENGHPGFHMNILRSFKKIGLNFSAKANFDCEVLHCSRLLPRRMPLSSDECGISALPFDGNV